MRLAAQVGEAYKALLEDNLLAAEARPHPRDPAASEATRRPEQQQAAAEKPRQRSGRNPTDDPILQ